MNYRLIVGGLLLSSVAAFGAPCVSGTLQSYIALGASGCQAGAVQFSNFVIAPGQAIATPIGPSSITVAPGGTQYNPLLLFTLNSTAIAGQIFEAFTRFTASGLLTGASITLNSPTVAGDGAVTGILDVCAGGTFTGSAPSGCSGTARTALALATVSDTILSDQVAFPLSNSVDSFVDLTVDGGLSGRAVLPSASVGFTAVPEPSALLLVAAGLGILGLRRTRRAF
jgi:hypothetical protein